MNRHAPFEIGVESESGHGWSYGVTRHHPDGSISTHTIGLSWADHESISGGIYPPSETIRAVCLLLDEHERAGSGPSGAGIGMNRLPARLDVSTIRRLVPRFDERIGAFVGLPNTDNSARVDRSDDSDR